MKKIIPSLDYESELWQNGEKIVAGIDEVGRGAWAGPVVAAAVVFKPDHKQIDLVKDSKMLTPSQRARLNEQIQSSCKSYGIGVVDNVMIDQVNIGTATKLAMQKAIESLENYPDYILVDAMELDGYCNCRYQAVIKGDQIIYSISCASIVAKVARDNMMSKLDKKYEQYFFDVHKGYGTQKHQQALQEHGPCDLHRYSYKPVGRMI